jgi:hypothetical protein
MKPEQLGEPIPNVFLGGASPMDLYQQTLGNSGRLFAVTLILNMIQVSIFSGHS